MSFGFSSFKVHKTQILLDYKTRLSTFTKNSSCLDELGFWLTILLKSRNELTSHNPYFSKSWIEITAHVYSLRGMGLLPIFFSTSWDGLKTCVFSLTNQDSWPTLFHLSLLMELASLIKAYIYTKWVWKKNFQSQDYEIMRPNNIFGMSWSTRGRMNLQKWIGIAYIMKAGVEGFWFEV